MENESLCSSVNSHFQLFSHQRPVLVTARDGTARHSQRSSEAPGGSAPQEDLHPGRICTPGCPHPFPSSVTPPRDSTPGEQGQPALARSPTRAGQQHTVCPGHLVSLRHVGHTPHTFPAPPVLLVASVSVAASEGPRPLSSALSANTNSGDHHSPALGASKSQGKNSSWHSCSVTTKHATPRPTVWPRGS